MNFSFNHKGNTPLLFATPSSTMPLFSIRPVICVAPRPIGASAFGNQIYNHLKNTPREYHAVFSHPEKWFSLNLMTPEILARILTDFPTVVDRTCNSFLNFAFNMAMWEFIPLTTPFTMERWVVIRNLYNISNSKMLTFAKDWTEKHLTTEKRIELFDHLMVVWRMRTWGNVHQKMRMISIAESLGDICEKHAKNFAREFEEEEKKTQFKEKKRCHKCVNVYYTKNCEYCEEQSKRFIRELDGEEEMKEIPKLGSRCCDKCDTDLKEHGIFPVKGETEKFLCTGCHLKAERDFKLTEKGIRLRTASEMIQYLESSTLKKELRGYDSDDYESSGYGSSQGCDSDSDTLSPPSSDDEDDLNELGDEYPIDP